MKIESVKTKFQPVVITLESQLEVDVLADVVSIMSSYSADTVHGTEQWKVKQFLADLAEGFVELSSDDYNFVYFDTPSEVLSFK